LRKWVGYPRNSGLHHFRKMKIKADPATLQFTDQITLPISLHAL